MASTTIKRLLQSPSPTNSQEHALEFLNTHFQPLEQLKDEETLQHVVDETRRKTDDLRVELLKSQAVLDEVIRDTLSSTRRYLATAQELSLARHALTDELSSLSAELVSSMNPDGRTQPTLMEELESLHGGLKELESVRNYVLVIERALRLSERAVAQVQDRSSSEARGFSSSLLTHYRVLQSFVLSVSLYCSSVENPSQAQVSVTHNQTEPLKIVEFLSKIRDRAWADIKGILTFDLLMTAEKMGWPQPIEYSSAVPDDRTLFELKFLDLIRLQDAGDEIHESDPHWKRNGIYPIQALVSPIALRFKFHFETKRDTNRMDKPEWYFTHILNVTHTHRSFMENTVQGLLSTTHYQHIDAFEFTLYLLPLLTRKLRHTIPRLLHHPSHLAHTIYQSLAFDASLKDQGFSLKRTTAAKEVVESKDIDSKVAWEGTSGQILGKKEWFEAWLEGEHKFAEDQYNDIISSPDAWQICDDVDDANNSGIEVDFRPTNSARRVKALIEQITDRYQPLPGFTTRTRFLITIQLPILESYHSRISSSLDAFETLSSSFVRAVPGALAGQVGHGSDGRRLTGGVEGMGRLVKASVSAHYIAAEMERWGEDLFFLELWSEINARAALRARADIHPLLPDPTGQTLSAPQDVDVASKATIFQELVTQYRSLGERAEDMIVRHVCSEVESASKAYFTNHWDNSQDSSPDETLVSVPTTLVAPISILSSHLVSLTGSLPSSIAATLYRRICSSLASIILHRRILQRGIGRLTLVEAKHIAEECLLWVQACRMTMGHSVRRVEGPWAQILDVMKLLTLEQDQFSIAVGRVFDTGADGLQKLSEDLEVPELDPSQLVDIVRLRDDCWR